MTTIAIQALALTTNVFVPGMLIVVVLLLLMCALRIVTFAAEKLPGCWLYVGRTRHSRLKGGSTHHFEYPLFFSFIDLAEIETIGWSMWPIFKVNSGWGSFCSLDYADHLGDWDQRQQKQQTATALQKNSSNRRQYRLLDQARDFVKGMTKNTVAPKGPVKLLAHLTYFGYCFNPISIFYFLREDSPDDKSRSNHKPEIPSSSASSVSLASKQPTLPQDSMIESIVVEVSNTPWIEQHSYMIDESIDGVSVRRNCDQHGSLQATWNKAFHVSPFMEMDYRYDFTFSEPRETMWVKSKMLKLSTGEVWFTASFELDRIAFTPLNLLYVLVFYPMHTRMIQVLIHFEAVKLFWKGIPTFEHPLGADVDFGLGVTGKRLGAVMWVVIAPFYYTYACFGVVLDRLGLVKSSSRSAPPAVPVPVSAAVRVKGE